MIQLAKLNKFSRYKIYQLLKLKSKKNMKKLYYNIAIVISSLLLSITTGCASMNLLSAVRSTYEDRWMQVDMSQSYPPSGAHLLNLLLEGSEPVRKLISREGIPDYVKHSALNESQFRVNFIFVTNNLYVSMHRISGKTERRDLSSVPANEIPNSLALAQSRKLIQKQRDDDERVARQKRIEEEEKNRIQEKNRIEEIEKLEQLRLATAIAKEKEAKRLIQERRDQLEKMESAAKGGDRIAQFNYAETLMLDAKPNADMIFEMYRKSADQGYTEAQIKLGQCYLNANLNTSVDLEKGVDILKKATEGGDARALNALGQAYLSLKDGCFLDPTNAIQCFTIAYEKDNSDAMYNLGYCYGMGIGVEKDNNEAIEWFRRSAEKDNRKAQYVLGRLQKDETFLRKSCTSEAALEMALNAYASFQRDRGIVNMVGAKLPIESYDAVRYQFEKAAKSGDMVSSRKCAQFIHKVRSYDLEDAIKYYARASEKGDSISTANLHGCLLLKCISEELARNRSRDDTLSGISEAKKFHIGMSLLMQTAPSSCDQRDPESVLKWVDRSMLKSSKVLYLLGRYQLEGSCIRRLSFEERDYDFYETQNNRDDSNLKEGLKLVREAAEAGEPEAMCYLARCYQTGSLLLIPQNVRDAVKWYQRAADAGSELAKKELSTFEHQKRVFDKKVAFCDKTPDERTSYINWRAIEMAKKTIVAKNVYLGMPIDEALFVFARLNFRCTTNDIIKFNKDEGKNVRTGTYYFDQKSKLTLFADENNCLRCFVLPPVAVKVLFDFTSPTVQTLSEDFSRLFDIKMEETERSTPVIDIRNKDVLSFSGSESKYYRGEIKNLQIIIFDELVYRKDESKSTDSITARLLGNQFSDRFCIPSGSIVFRDDSAETSSL